MRLSAAVVLLFAPPLAAQGRGDSLVKNMKVFPATPKIIEVAGPMRNFTSALGVRCTYCHVGSEDIPIEQYDFANDTKRA